MANRDPRATELSHLKLALATFALQLDAFEARLKCRSLKTTVQASEPVPSDIGFANKIISAMKSSRSSPAQTAG
jgi:hypothetical protein